MLQHAMPATCPALLARGAAKSAVPGQRTIGKRWFCTALGAALALAAALAVSGCGTGSNVETRALHVALAQRGKPYVYGAAGPNAFDCSGLVQYSFARAGRVLPRVATAQYHASRHIPASSVRPGDLIFFGSPVYMSHVAIYAGGGTIVAAPHTGTVVKTERIWTAHYYVGRIN